MSARKSARRIKRVPEARSSFPPYLVLVTFVIASIALFSLLMPFNPQKTPFALSTQPYTELDPSQNPTPITMAQAKDIFNTNSSILQNWRAASNNQVPGDNEPPNTLPGNEPTARLVRDDSRGNTHWEVANASHSAWIDAYSGIILHYGNTDYSQGNLMMPEAITLARQKAESFASFPADVRFSQIVLRILVGAAEMNPSGNGTNFSGQQVYVVRFARFLENVPSHDGILVILSTNRQLIDYDKTYSLIMPQHATPSISQQQAENIAKTVFNGTVNQTTLEIVRPNYYWSGGPYYGDNNGRLSWVVTLQSVSGVNASVWVDALDGSIAGGDSTY